MILVLRTNKFGARIRKLVVAALTSKKLLYECPACGKTRVRRTSFSRWQCKSCDSQFAGGAYTFTTEAGIIANRLTGEYQGL